MMNKITLSIILLVICLNVSGQQINQPTNHYRCGDVLEKNPLRDCLLDLF